MTHAPIDRSYESWKQSYNAWFVREMKKGSNGNEQAVASLWTLKATSPAQNLDNMWFMSIEKGGPPPNDASTDITRHRGIITELGFVVEHVLPPYLALLFIDSKMDDSSVGDQRDFKDLKTILTKGDFTENVSQDSELGIVHID